jgi:hypothetical protein
MKHKICKNCGNHFTGQFCNECGQKDAHRITLSHIGHEFIHAFTHADKGIFHLFLQLFIRPGKVAYEYIVEGKRKKYFPPFQYILILGTIAAFVAINSHFLEHAMEIAGQQQKYSKRQIEFMNTISHFQTKYYNFVILMQLPFLALASFLVYRKKGLYYAEHLTLQTFITAQTSVIGMIVMIVIGLSGKFGIYIGFILAFMATIFQVFAYMQFFSGKTWKDVLRAFSSNLLGQFFFMLFMVVIIVSVLIISVLIKKYT